MSNSIFTRVVAVIALVFSMIAFYFSLGTRELNQKAVKEIEAGVKKEIVEEVWVELKPLYKDFGIPANNPPSSVGELIRPLLGVQNPASIP